MGGCRSKDQTQNTIRRVQPRQSDASINSSRLLKPNASRILEVNYLKIPNKFKRSKTKNESLNPSMNQDNQICGLRGIMNLGNTCFLNSAIQCLSNTQPLTDYFVSNLHTAEINVENPLSSKGQVTTSFARLIKQIWQKIEFTDPHKYNQNAVQPIDFINCISKWAPQFAYGNQEDAHEFLASILDMIHEDLNRVKKKPSVEEKEYNGEATQQQADESWKHYLMQNRSVIVDLFQGQQKSTLKCGTCFYQSNRFEPFMYLSIPVFDEDEKDYKPPFFIEDSIKEYCKEEKMIGEEQWFCPKCKVKRNSIKKIDLWTMPSILVIHLKRFKFTRDKRCKLRTFIDFPLVGLNFENISQGRQNGNPTYDLYAVVNHEGTLARGHYTTYAKNRDDLSWYFYNDSIIRKIDNYEDRVVSSDAYLLFYFKNSVEEFQRQTLTSEQWQALELKQQEFASSNKKLEQKIAFQKTLKNTIIIKTNQVLKQKKSNIMDKIENSNIYPDDDQSLHALESQLDISHFQEEEPKKTNQKTKLKHQVYRASLKPEDFPSVPQSKRQSGHQQFSFDEINYQSDVNMTKLSQANHRQSKRHLMKISLMGNPMDEELLK